MSLYTIEELVQAHELFSETPDTVRAALTMQGKDKFTKAEAGVIIKNFAKREI